MTASPSQINFLIFVPIFSILSMVYLEVAPRVMPKGNAHQERYQQQQGVQERKLTHIVSHPYAHLGFEVVNMLFYFAGFVALATFLGKLLFCRGSVCAAARADAVFAAFSWLLWTGTSAILALEIFRGGFKGVQTDVAAKQAMKQEIKKTEA